MEKTREDLGQAEEERDALQQVLTYCSIVYANSDQDLERISELCSASKKKVESLVRIFQMHGMYTYNALNSKH